MSYLSTRKPWPFCQANIEVPGVLNPSFFPIRISRDTLFKWMYRVRKWRIDYSVSYTMNMNWPGTQTGTYSGYSIVGPNYGDESEFNCNVDGDLNVAYVLAPNVTSYTATQPPDPPVTGPESGTAAVQFAVSQFHWNGIDGDYGIATDFERWLRLNGMVDETDDYLINLVIYASGSFARGQVCSSRELSSSLYPYSPCGVSCTMDGLNVPLFNLLSPDVDSVITVGAITITPVEYWEYDPGAGPVYSSTTGAQLRDPASIQAAEA